LRIILLAPGVGDKLPNMLQIVPQPLAGDRAAGGREACLAAYRFMLQARLLDDKFAALYRAGKINGGVFLGRGQEALSAPSGFR
jgi:TPP-dependent pyruvate/acetoin dehydrogenase alpha subunit